MSQKTGNTTKGDGSSRKSTTHDADGDVATPLTSSEKGKDVTVVTCEDSWLYHHHDACYVVIST